MENHVDRAGPGGGQAQDAGATLGVQNLAGAGASTLATQGGTDLTTATASVTTLGGVAPAGDVNYTSASGISPSAISRGNSPR